MGVAAQASRDNWSAFVDNLDRYRRGQPAEPAWQKAWSLCERRDPDNPALPVMRGLLAGVAAPKRKAASSASDSACTATLRALARSVD